MNLDYSISRFYEIKLKIYRWEWMEGRFLDVLHSKWEVVCALRWEKNRCRAKLEISLERTSDLREEGVPSEGERQKKAE